LSARCGAAGEVTGAADCRLRGQYNDLPDYVIFAVLLLYILTTGGLNRFRRARPEMERPCRPAGYPVPTALCMPAAGVIAAGKSDKENA